MNDSSYDSLENELNEDSGSLFQPMQRSRGKPDSRSYDSVLTLSDCDLDQTDAEPDITVKTHLLHPSLAWPVKTSPLVSPSTSHLHSPCKESSFPKGVRQLRRSSEPAIWNSTSSLTRYLECKEHRKGSYECVTSQSKSDVDLEADLNTLRLEKQSDSGQKDQNVRNVPQQLKQQQKPSPLHLDTSCTNLCSPGASPVHSSVSSLDSASSQHSADFNKHCPHIIGSFKALVKSSPRLPGIVSETSGLTIPSHKEYPPKEKLDWNQLRNSHGLHPNTWLKKDHRLSLSKDKGGLNDKDISEPILHSENFSKTSQSKERGAQEPGIPPARKRSTSPICPEDPLLEAQQGQSPALEKILTVKELREIHNQACSVSNQTPVRKYSQKSTPGCNTSSLPQSVFYGQSVRHLALYRKKAYSLIPVEEKSHVRPSLQRRASEPGETRLGLDSETTKSLEHIHRQALRKQDTHFEPHAHGPKLSDLERDDNYSKPQVSLSPAATKAVRNYFFWQGGEDTQSNLKKSQEVALAVVHGKREWMRRCSDTQLEDFEKMLFSEESYV